MTLEKFLDCIHDDKSDFGILSHNINKHVHKIIKNNKSYITGEPLFKEDNKYVRFIVSGGYYDFELSANIQIKYSFIKDGLSINFFDKHHIRRVITCQRVPIDKIRYLKLYELFEKDEKNEKANTTK